MNELNKLGLLHTECMTATGKTVGENIKGCVNKNPEIIRPVENPYSKTGGIAVLKGNLAPDTAVVKRSAVVPEMQVHEGPARVFDCEEDAIEAIRGGKIVAGDVVVIRYEGPKGGPGTVSYTHLDVYRRQGDVRADGFAVGDPLKASENSVVVERTALYDDVASQLGGIRNFNYLI